MHSIENEFYFKKNPQKLENNNILTIDKKFRKKNQHFNLPSLWTSKQNTNKALDNNKSPSPAQVCQKLITQ